MLATIYRALWTRIGGRPWTYIARDWTCRRPLRIVLSAFAGGLLVGLLLPVAPVFAAIAGLVMGVAIGHIWWDTRGQYIPDEYRERDDA